MRGDVLHSPARCLTWCSPLDVVEIAAEEDQFRPFAPQGGDPATPKHGSIRPHRCDYRQIRRLGRADRPRRSAQTSARDIAPQRDPRDAPQLHFVGAFVDFADLAVTPDGLEMVDSSVRGKLTHKPVTTVDLDRVPRDVDSDPAAADLGHRGLWLRRVALVGLAGGLLIERPGILQRYRVLGEAELPVLERAQFRAERTAATQVSHGVVEGALAHPDPHRADTNPA